MTIDALPTAPNRNMPDSTYVPTMDAFIAALPTLVSQVNAATQAMNLNATTGTSATSNTIGTGAKTFTADLSKSWLGGMYVVIADTFAPSTNGMYGQVTSYDSGTGTLVVNVLTTWGGGTKSAWIISQSGQITPSDDAILARHLGDSALGFSLINGTLVSFVNANALTVAIKTKTGADPSATDPVLCLFRNATLATGDFTVMSITAANSLVISFGSTLGMVSGQAARLYIVGFNDGGTFRLGIYNPWDDTNKVLQGLAEGSLYSSTAEGGAGAADAALTIYTGVAVASKPIRILGYIEVTEAAAGTWATAPSKVQLMGPGVRKTGDIVQIVRSASGAVATGTTLLPNDDTIPQNTEGDQYMTQAITPNAAPNILKIDHLGFYSNTAGNVRVITALFQDSIANALAATQGICAASVAISNKIEHEMVAGVAVSTTFKIRAGSNVAGTTSFNGEGGARRYGGVANSHLTITEIHA